MTRLDVLTWVMNLLHCLCVFCVFFYCGGAELEWLESTSWPAEPELRSSSVCRWRAWGAAQPTWGKRATLWCLKPCCWKLWHLWLIHRSFRSRSLGCVYPKMASGSSGAFLWSYPSVSVLTSQKLLMLGSAECFQPLVRQDSLLHPTVSLCRQTVVCVNVDSGITANAMEWCTVWMETA